MTDIICINDQFAPEWEVYFKTHGIVTPVKDKMYSIREIVPYLVGEKGLLLNEIINPPTPRISITTGLEGVSEQSWAVSRFRDLLGNELRIERAATSVKNNDNNHLKICM